MSIDQTITAGVRHSDAGHWVPASGGKETPFKARSGARLLYCWNPVTKFHAYLNLDTDMILSDDEAQVHLWGPRQ